MHLNLLRLFARGHARPHDVPTAGPVTRLGPLRVEAGWIMAASGPVRLSGTSLFWTNLQPRFFDPAAIRWLADDWRTDIVRVPIGIAEEGPPMKLAEAVTLAHRAIDGAIAADRYVVVDWHAHDRHEEAAACLAAIARHYGDLPNILYETWNEPAPGIGWPIIRDYHVVAIDAVRAHAPSAVVLAGTPEHCRRVDQAAAAPVARPNVAYALHFYAGTHRDGLRDLARSALAAGAALMVTEWGVAEADGDGTIDWQETERWLAFLAETGIGDIAWSITDKHEACAALTPRAASDGRWGRQALTPTGRFLRDRLRRERR